MNIDYPNNQTAHLLIRPNYSNQGVFNPSLEKGERGYYGNDNNANYYPNSSSGFSNNSKFHRPDKYPNSNKAGRN